MKDDNKMKIKIIFIFMLQTVIVVFPVIGTFNFV